MSATIEHNHEWHESDVVVDTYPPTYHRSCECGRVEAKFGARDEWRECFESNHPSEPSFEEIMQEAILDDHARDGGLR